MKYTSCLIIMLFMFVALHANPVTIGQAREVGYKFLDATQKTSIQQRDELCLVQTYRCRTGEAAFYVFNYNEGYVIVSADDCATPILGYSYEGPFNPEDIPIQMQDYLNGFLEQIQYGVAHRLMPDDNIAAQWNKVRTTGRIKEGNDGHQVLPLLNDKWGQGCYYNTYCPEDSLGPCGHAYVGCVATAMAQIMNYWKYPESGQGSHSYLPSSHPEYGEQSVVFSATTYDWDNMPNGLYAGSSEVEIDAVATLMRHCGVAVDMLYGPHGSGAFSDDIAPALSTYFQYSDELYLMDREDDSIWLFKVKECLDLLRPVYYIGYAVGPDGVPADQGHAFVCDGYDREDLLHFNWGWNGLSNGYFALGNNWYSFGNEAIFDIHVPSDTDHPCQINVAANHPDAGMVEGGGTYHYGDLCVLTAHVFEGYRFRAWMDDNAILSIDSVFTFPVLGDRDIVALFEGPWSTEVMVSCVQDSVQTVQRALVSWDRDSLGGGNGDTSWHLLTSFDFNTNVSSTIATDGLNIYTSMGLTFQKRDFSGRVLDSFVVEGCGMIADMAFDGQFFYGGTNGSVLYCVDLVNKAFVDTIPTSCRSLYCCTYDPDNDGFWVNDQTTLTLIDRNGNTIKTGPTFTSFFSGSFYKNAQGKPHLFVITIDEGKVFDYDIEADVLGQDALCCFPDGKGRVAFLANDLDRTLLFATKSFGLVEIYQLPTEVLPISYYRVYRISGFIDDENAIANRELIADRQSVTSYVDQAWDTLPAGYYTYGVSLIKGIGESDISWSEPIKRTQNHSIDEQNETIVSLYPNPARDCLVVESSRPVRCCEVYSITGTKVFHQGEIDGTNREIDVSMLTPGLYLIRLITDHSTLIQKFVKQ